MKKSTEQLHAQKMLRVLSHIQEELNSELSLEELANVASMSRYHFHRVFRAATGESLQEHIKRLKLERAAQLIRQSDRKIVGIALESGFNSHEGFSRAFRKHFKVSPSDYRYLARGQSHSDSNIYYNSDLTNFELRIYGETKMNVSISNYSGFYAAYVKHIGSYSDVGASWNTLMHWAQKERIITKSSRYFGIGYDDVSVTPESKLRYDACITLEGARNGDGIIGVQYIKGGLFAVVEHKGSHDSIEETYLELYGSWLPKSKYVLADRPCLVEYLNSPFDTKVKELRTLIYLPLVNNE